MIYFKTLGSRKNRARRLKLRLAPEERSLSSRNALSPSR